MTEIGKRLESLRNGHTQREYAKLLGVPLTSYTNWLKGPSLPKMENIVTICTNLGISSDWLLGLSDQNINGGGVPTVTYHNEIDIGEGKTVSRDCMECPLLQAHLKRFSRK